MKLDRRTIVGALCAALWCSTARAQAPNKDADAERLFQEGQKLLEERRYGEACPKFQAAYAKDHQLGTLLNLAYCHKEQKSYWDAWLEFKEAEVRAIELNRPDRRDFARQRMAELEGFLVRVVVDPQTKLELTDVLVEEHRVPEAEKGVVFFAEPGSRKFTFRAKGKKDREETFKLATTKVRAAQHIAVPAMEDAEAPPPPPAPPPPEPTPVVVQPQVEHGSGQKTLALALAGFGVVAIGVGTVTGLMTLSNACTKSSQKDNPDGCQQNDTGRELADRGRATAMISNISFAAGGAALLGALGVYLLAPSGKTSTTAMRPSVTPALGMGYAGVSGVF
jgi:hypothetical protein